MEEFFSYAEALKYLGGYDSLFRKLRAKFLENYGDYLEKLDYEIKNDIKEARNMVHSLKGITKNLGATELYQVSVMVEEKLDKGEEVDFSSYFEVYKKTYQAIKDFVVAA